MELAKGIFWAFLPYIVIGVINAMIIRWAQIKEKWSWPLAIIAFSVISAASISIYNNLPIEWPLRSFEVERNTRSWLDDEGCSIKTIRDPEYRFVLGVTQSEVYFNVSNKKEDSPIAVNVYTRVNLSEDDQKYLSNLSENRRLHFLEQVKIELLRTGVQFQIHLSPNKQLQYTELVSSFLYTNSPNAKSEFYNNIGLVLRGVKLSQAFFAELRRGNL
jgi:hypothetical protein